MNKVLALTVCFYFVAAGNAAGELEVPRNIAEVGTELYYFKYEEPGVMEENGIMYGITAAYTSRDTGYIFRDKWMFRAEGRAAFGQVDYKNSGTIDNIFDATFEFRGLGGYDFDVSASTLITPYLGIGYRYLNDDTSGKYSSTGAVGYERESNYFYSPIGIETISDLDNDWFLSFNVEYDIFWKGIQKSHLSDANPLFDDLENDQNKGYGARGSAKLSRKGEDIDFSIESFIRYWNIKKSEEENVAFSGVIVGYGYEPKNNTVEAGVEFAISF